MWFAGYDYVKFNRTLRQFVGAMSRVWEACYSVTRSAVVGFAAGRLHLIYGDVGYRAWLGNLSHPRWTCMSLRLSLSVFPPASQLTLSTVCA